MTTVVMTGATSGIGRVAAEHMLRMPDVQLWLGARGVPPPGAHALPLDLARLASVRAFAQTVSERLGETPIDALVLNAATQFPNDTERTEDGFETTFAVNHLAHYLLLRLLLPRLAEAATVLITTSDTHDPALNPIAPPDHADAERLAHPVREAGVRSRPFRDGFRAYSASKLCNLLTARALGLSKAAEAKRLSVIAYNPGFTLGTGLQRRAPLGIRLLTRTLRPIVVPLFRINKPAQAGQMLADLALGRIAPPPGRLYASLVKRRFTWPRTSDLAQRDEIMSRLWSDSARMVGLTAPANDEERQST
ncbi:SDR family NAD(P)-dependent oxidoreductase [Methylosinus sp. LW4]|uniref:SDR family NAD(P)-dependent oxidoreductase n=1 Tax=Methylosinus sp. LW4 TaxID=136993 RepID=UPI00036B6A5E|nr:SDR family NAD(P)-dependent oxidoreductase [Methylosinus sp. LW4]